MVENKKKLVWNEIKPQIFNKWFLFLAIALILFVLCWTIFPSASRPLKIVSLAIFVVFDILYITHISWKTADEIIFTKAFYVMQSFVFIMLFFAYIFVSTKDYSYAVILIIVLFLIILIGLVVKAINYLVKSKNTTGVIITYVYASFTIILLFAFVLSIPVDDQNHLIYSQNQTRVVGIWEYVYYSSEMYYSSNPGDIFPIGTKIKVISQIEAACSFIIHVILLNQILGGLKNSFGRDKH